MQSQIALAIGDEVDNDSKALSAKRTSVGSSLKLKKHTHSQSMLVKKPSKDLRQAIAAHSNQWTLLSVNRNEKKSTSRKKIKKAKHAYFY